MGLNEEWKSKLFSTCRRLPDHVPGSGVGLYLAKRIVESVGSSRQVQNQADIGSIFTVALSI